MSADRWLGNVLRRMMGRAPSGRPPKKGDPAGTLDHYVTTRPSLQNAIDAVPGWSHAFPPELDLKAGDAHLYGDDRITWALEQMGSLEGHNVLELGPLEGMHTWMLDKAGARRIDAVEANALAYMRCLVTKEVLGIRNARFLLGDFNAWMEDARDPYDLVVASGVLYHSADPIRLLELIARNANAFYLWTHYFDGDAMPVGDRRRPPFSGVVVAKPFGDFEVALHERSYYKAWRDPKFCGGFRDIHYWMTKADIIRVVEALGFSAVVAHDQPDHPFGPAFSVFGRRTLEAPSQERDSA